MMKQVFWISVALTFCSFSTVNTGKKYRDHNITTGNEVKNLRFSWGDCTPKITGTANSPAVIKKIEVSPDPIVIPGDVSVGFEVDANVNLTSPSLFSIRIKKKVAFFWIDVPCQDGQGSCDYDDFCAKWPIPGPSCPAAYRENNIPCQCPLPAQAYKLPLSDAGHVDGGSIPKWLENGEYKIKAWVTEPKSGQIILCVNLDVNLKAA